MTDLAIHNKDGYLSLKEISERQEISMKYLENIVATLCKAGFLDSMRGKNGGYQLRNQPSAYTIGTILQVAEGSLSPVACLNSDTDIPCSRLENCITLPLWQKLDSVVNNYLNSITLADLLNGTV